MTGIVVTYNTAPLFRRAYNSIRKFHPKMELIIVDGSDPRDACFSYVRSLADYPYNIVYQLKYNIGHGKGLHFGLQKCNSDLALVFDSDIEMLQSPVEDMKKLMNSEVYGIGWLYEVGRDGFDFGTPGFNHKEPIPYIHPYFMLLNVEQYFKYHRFVHHGAPCYKAMVDLYDNKQSWRLISFPGLTGHTSGEGVNWKGKPSKYIRHDFGGTRMNNKHYGKEEIQGTWE